LFFFVVAGQEDLAFLVEAVNKAQEGVWGSTHRREDSESGLGVKSKVKSQKAKVKVMEGNGRRTTEEGRRRGDGVFS
jgi:hypothetical protein